MADAEATRRERIRANHLELLAVMQSEGLPAVPTPAPPPSERKSGRIRKKKRRLGESSDSELDADAWSGSDDSDEEDLPLEPVLPAKTSRKPPRSTPAVKTEVELSPKPPKRPQPRRVDDSIIGALPIGVKSDVKDAMKPTQSRAVALLMGNPTPSVVTTVGSSSDGKDDRAWPDVTRFQSVSTRQIPLDVASLQANWLGKSIPYEITGGPGKKGKLAVAVACCGTVTPNVCPMFSPLSGITQFANGVVLWVNVGGDNYNNVFTWCNEVPVWLVKDDAVPKPKLDIKTKRDGGKVEERLFVSWYASRSQSEHTPIIQSMLTANSDDVIIDTKPDTPQPRLQFHVVLCCRLPDEPYVYCGRLRYCAHGYVSEDTPTGSGRESLLKFVWEMVDGPVLRAREAFARLLG